MPHAECNPGAGPIESARQRISRWLRRPLRNWLAVVVVVGLLARLVRYGVGFPIWGDEAFVAVNFLTRDWKGLLEPLEFEMVVPVGYLLPTHALAQVLGTSELALRLPALVAGIAALLLFVAFARRFHRSHASLAAIALLAASYYPIRHGAEVKPYALDLLVGTVVTFSAWGVLRRPRAGSRWALFSAAGVLGVWCSYPAIFVAGGAALVLGVNALSAQVTTLSPRQPHSVRNAIWSALAIGASFLAMYLLVGRHQQWTQERMVDARQWEEHFPPLAKPWLLPLWLLAEHTGNMAAYPNGGPNFGSSATLLLASIGGISLWKTGRTKELALLLAPLLPMFVAAALQKYPYGGSARTTLHLAIPTALLVGEAISATVALLRRSAMPAAKARNIAWATRGFAALMVLHALGIALADVLQPFKEIGDVKNRAACRELAAATRPGDRWVFFGVSAASVSSTRNAKFFSNSLNKRSLR